MSAVAQPLPSQDHAERPTTALIALCAHMLPGPSPAALALLPRDLQPAPLHEAMSVLRARPDHCGHKRIARRFLFRQVSKTAPGEARELLAELGCAVGEPANLKALDDLQKTLDEQSTLPDTRNHASEARFNPRTFVTDAVSRIEVRAPFSELSFLPALVDPAGWDEHMGKVFGKAYWFEGFPLEDPYGTDPEPGQHEAGTADEGLFFELAKMSVREGAVLSFRNVFDMKFDVHWAAPRTSGEFELASDAQGSERRKLAYVRTEYRLKQALSSNIVGSERAGGLDVDDGDAVFGAVHNEPGWTYIHATKRIHFTRSPHGDPVEAALGAGLNVLAPAIAGVLLDQLVVGGAQQILARYAKRGGVSGGVAADDATAGNAPGSARRRL